MKILKIETYFYNSPETRKIWWASMLFCIAFAGLLTSCVSPEGIGSIVKEGTEGVAKIQLANTAKSIADTRKIKAKTTEKFGNDVMALIGEQPIEKQAKLISESIQAKVDVANASRYKGLLEGASIWLFLIVISRVVRYIYSIYKPIPKSVKY